jgi:hypothetical protein
MRSDWPEAPWTAPVTMFGMSGLHHPDIPNFDYEAYENS